MNNHKVMCEVAEPHPVKFSLAVQSPILPRKKAQILDDTWLEALKHFTCPQWSLMSLVSRQVNGVIQRNLSRLPRQVLECATLQWFDCSFEPIARFLHVEASMSRSLQLLFHPIVYFKKVTFYVTHQKLTDVHCIISNTEGCHIRCHSFILNTYGNTLRTRPNTTALSTWLKWLERSVRSDSISFPEWISYKVHETVEARALLSDFIFGASQKCKVQELIFAYSEHRVEFLNNLIEDFLTFPDVQSTIPTVVMNRYTKHKKSRSKFGENLIDREVDSQGAYALYEIENGDKRIRISFCYCSTWDSGCTAYVKFYTI